MTLFAMTSHNDFLLFEIFLTSSFFCWYIYNLWESLMISFPSLFMLSLEIVLHTLVQSKYWI